MDNRQKHFSASAVAKAQKKKFASYKAYDK
jgi:hypothetical protein